MPEPQPGAGRPADGSTPGSEPDRDPAVVDEPTSPPVPPDQPQPSAQPQPMAQPQPTAQPDSSAQPEPPAQPDSSTQPEPPAQPDSSAPPEPSAQPFPQPGPPAQPEPSAQSDSSAPPEPSAQPGSSDQPEAPSRPQSPGQPEPPTEQAGSAADSPAATEPVPAPRWSGSAPVPPPLPRRRAWGESDEPTPPPPAPAEPPEHRTPVDPWAGVDTGSWDLSHAELPPLPPTLPYPTPPATRQWSGPPAAPVGPPPAPPPAVPLPPPPTRPALPSRPVAPPASPPRPPKQRRARRSAAPPPVTPPPGWQAPKGYVPVPVRRRRRWPWLLLLTLACCCGCPAYYGLPISTQYPARAALPEQVADLRLRQDDSSAEAARQLEREVRQSHWLAEDTFAGVYATSDGKRVTVFGGTGFRLTPEEDAKAEIDRLSERYALEAPEAVDTGVRGRHEQCAVGQASGSDVVVCTSVDHGSIATGVFTRLSVPDSAALLNTLRTQIVIPDRT
ncbi:hypothetical protein [Micromonospora vulcania]|uniref:Agglutinin receptor n=1 Tax=Micromonospora vulcania TaxID=1441873 RepID=A0ABW1HC10_9ACTN